MKLEEAPADDAAEAPAASASVSAPVSPMASPTADRKPSASASASAPSSPKTEGRHVRRVSINLRKTDDKEEKEEKAANSKMKAMLHRRQSSRQEAKDVVAPTPGVSIDTLRSFVEDVKALRAAQADLPAEERKASPSSSSSDSDSSEEEEKEAVRARQAQGAAKAAPRLEEAEEEVLRAVAAEERNRATAPDGDKKLAHLTLARARWSVARRLPSRRQFRSLAARAAALAALAEAEAEAGTGDEAEAKATESRVRPRRAAGVGMVLPPFDPTKVVLRKSAHN